MTCNIVKLAKMAIKINFKSWLRRLKRSKWSLQESNHAETTNLEDNGKQPTIADSSQHSKVVESEELRESATVGLSGELRTALPEIQITQDDTSIPKLCTNKIAARQTGSPTSGGLKIIDKRGFEEKPYTNSHVTMVLQRCRELLLTPLFYNAYAKALGSRKVKEIETILTKQWPAIWIASPLVKIGPPKMFIWTQRMFECEDRIYINCRVIEVIEQARICTPKMTILLFACMVHEIAHYISARLAGVELEILNISRGSAISSKEVGEAAESAVFGGVMLAGTKLAESPLCVIDGTKFVVMLDEEKAEEWFWDEEGKLQLPLTECAGISRVEEQASDDNNAYSLKHLVARYGMCHGTTIPRLTPVEVGYGRTASTSDGSHVLH